ncbi:MAG: FkbM family methyltransferase [Solirubrobacteraceae bacterium]
MRVPPARLRYEIDRFRLKRLGLPKAVEVPDGAMSHRFHCTSLEEYKRAIKFFTKEPGTLAFLRAELRPGDVFCDVGACTGLYTILAAKLVGPQGAVYAFEAHAASFNALLVNIASNGVSDRTKALSLLLGRESGFVDLAYTRLGSGSSRTIAHGDSIEGAQVATRGTEVKRAATLDELVEADVLSAPTVVKIDVDGHELAVLGGMQSLLAGEQRPRALQVEVDPEVADRVLAEFSDYGYRLTDRHFSSGRAAEVAAGGDPDSLVYNGIFRR